MDDEHDDQGGLARVWLDATEALRGDDLPVPERSMPRPVVLDLR